MAAPDRRSRDQVRQLIRELEPVDYLRLLLIARAYGWVIDRDARDLLHDAIVRALDRRSCAIDVSAVGFLAGVMRSLVSDALRSAEARLNVSGLWHEPGWIDRVSADAPADAEDAVHSAMDAQQMRRRLEAILADDPALARFTEAVRDGAFGEQLSARLGIDRRAIATLRRRLARRISRLHEQRDQTEGRHGA